MLSCFACGQKFAAVVAANAEAVETSADAGAVAVTVKLQLLRRLRQRQLKQRNIYLQQQGQLQ